LAALLFALGLMWLVLRSRIGLFFNAIREDEEAAASLGVRVARWKLVAFTLSSALAGLAGGLYAHVLQLVAPSMMSLGEMGFILSMAVIGGFHNIFYAALGGIFLEVVLEALRAIGEWRLTLFGLVVIVVLRYAPNGVFGALARRLGLERSPP
jgi:branched-chain amino acid transport system permease protein